MNFINTSFDEIKDGEVYIVSGTHCWGDWSLNATAKFYRPGSHKSQLKRKFRFIDHNGNVVNHVECVESAK